MKTIKYVFFGLIVVGIISLLFVAIKGSSNEKIPAESNTSSSAESGVKEDLETPTESSNNIVVFKISPKFGGFPKKGE